MTDRIDVAPGMFQWALQRSGKSRDEVEQKKGLGRLSEWLSGDLRPTVAQLREFAKATYTPFGQYFCQIVPDEKLEIPDLRVMEGKDTESPSGNMLDIIYECEVRQEWYRDLMIENGYDQVEVSGMFDSTPEPQKAATELRELLGYQVQARGSTFEFAYNKLKLSAENQGVLVMRTGYVGTNTRRLLDPAEFRGFALADDYAPLVFINGRDTKAAQIFTLAHELAHITRKSTGVTNLSPVPTISNGIERWCNRLAANLLIPREDLREASKNLKLTTTDLDNLARKFKASALAVLLQLRNLGRYDEVDFNNIYKKELGRLIELADERRISWGESEATGGSYYNTALSRVGRPFAAAVIQNTRSGHTLHRDAVRMLNISSIGNLRELARHVGELL